jgi:hypothetical protein
MLPVRQNRIINCDLGIAPMEKDRSLKGRVAIVGYGPSLQDTWPRLKDFDTIWTVSRAHDFLLERGLKPTVHTDVDMRAHKTGFIDKLQPDVQYLLSSHIHPSYARRAIAAGVPLQLFHCGIEKDVKLDPRYPVAKVRYDASLQAAELAFQNGHREQHWFGIDYGSRGDQTHAGYHGGITSPACTVDVDGVLYPSTKLFFHGLLLAEQLLCDRALVKCHIHGNGLLGQFLKARGRVRPVLIP